MSQDGSAFADTRNMNTVHILFRREFGLMPDLVASVADEDIRRARTVADHIRFMNDVLHHHHEAEDAVLWPLLLERAPQEVDPVVRLAQGHHQRIDVLMGRAGQHLEAWADGAGARAGDALALALRQLDVVLFEHMNLEEQLVLPVVARHIFASEWAQMEEKSIGAADPRDVPLLLGMALYEGGDEIVPEPLRADVLPVAPGVYADYADRVYGTRTPPRASDVVIGAPSVSAAARLTS